MPVAWKCGCCKKGAWGWRGVKLVKQGCLIRTGTEAQDGEIRRQSVSILQRTERSLPKGRTVQRSQLAHLGVQRPRGNPDFKVGLHHTQGSG